MVEQELRMCVVGAGRAGRSFALALSRRGVVCDRLLDVGDDLARAGEAVDVVLVAVPDDVIASVAREIEPFPGVIVHVSGATGLDVLADHGRVGSVHPLVSLPDPETGATRLLDGAVFAVSGDPLAGHIVERLGGTAITVDDADRSLYHATATIAANHLVVLCAQVERLAERVGVPVAAYWELMDRTLGNVREAGAAAALTGPASRGDRSTIAAHLAAIGPHEQELYGVLARSAADLAAQPDPTTT